MAGRTNTGVANYISNPISSFPENSITMDIFGNTFYRGYSFGAGDDTGVYWNDKKEYSSRIMLFFVAAMQRAVEGKFSYGNKLRSSQSLDFRMRLPMKNGAIDFDFMERFIAELEAERIKELEAYLEAAGLKDYKLTPEEESTLGGGTRAWRTFNLRDLFTKKTMRGYPKKDENLEENSCGYPIYGQNIRWQYPQKVLLDKKYLHEVDHDYPILAYTSSVGEIGMIDESFYRSGDNGAFQGLFPKSRPYNRYELQFILCALKRHFVEFGYATSMADIMNLSFALPVQTDDVDEPIIDDKYIFHSDGFIPDFSFMATVISAVQKLVIRDVVLYSEKKIAAAKEAFTGKMEI